MSQQPHTHRNHPPITPHPETVFLPDPSVCITNSLEGTPVALQNRFAEKSLRFLIHHHHLQDTLSPISLPPSPEHIKVTLHVHDHSYHNLIHLLNKQFPSRWLCFL